MNDERWAIEEPTDNPEAMRGKRKARMDTQYAVSEQSPSSDSPDEIDIDIELDPFLAAMLAETHAAETADPDIAALAEHVVGTLLGGLVVAASRVRAARTEAALRRRPHLARRAASMQRRLERLTAGAEDPAEQFERLRGGPLQVSSEAGAVSSEQ